MKQQRVESLPLSLCTVTICWFHCHLHLLLPCAFRVSLSRFLLRSSRKLSMNRSTRPCTHSCADDLQRTRPTLILWTSLAPSNDFFSTSAKMNSRTGWFDSSFIMILINVINCLLVKTRPLVEIFSDTFL